MNHSLLHKILLRLTGEMCIHKYIKRWLEVPYEIAFGEFNELAKGVAQDSFLGPVLANLFSTVCVRYVGYMELLYRSF